MMTRRAILAGGTALLAMGSLRPAHAEAPATPEAMITAARDLAQAPYRSGGVAPVAPFDGLSYDSYRAVRPRPGHAAGLPLGERFRADLLPPGWLFAEPVTLHLPGHDTAFRIDLFDFDPAFVTLPDPIPDPGAMGFSGLRLLTRLNRPDRWDEVLVLQGASYFRALARDTVYGLSARGLALGTGGPGPEEFPATRVISVFEAGDRLQFGCLIDSPRAAAALIATLTPGREAAPETVMACALHLFPREVLADAGIAPLTSMFQHNALGPARIDDFRPRVHDSEALVIDNGAGERLWRPLANPAQLQMSAFADRGPKGFGLVQGPVSFAAFRDAEAAYHRRPSAWVRPRGDWGAGAVMLLEIPTRDEFADNIVAFWRPEAPLPPGAHRFDYDLVWLPPGAGALPQPALPTPFQPVSSASGVEPNRREGRLFVVDFAGSPLAADGVMPDLAPVVGAELTGLAHYPLADAPGQLRVSFILTPAPETDVAELRLQLRDRSGAPVSPVWLFRWTRRADGQV